MEVKTVYAVYFSATGNTRKVVTTLANAIAQTLEIPLEVVDFTLPAAREGSYAFSPDDLVIFGMPTYAGKLPNKLLPYVQSGFAGNGALAVPVVTFGNRSFDNALAELSATLEQDGFHTIAAGPPCLYRRARRRPSRPAGYDSSRPARRHGCDKAWQNDGDPRARRGRR